jgi:subtilisin family serine protease
VKKRRILAGALAVPAAAVLVAAFAPTAIAGAPAAPQGGETTEYTVLVEQGASRDAAVAAVRRAGGKVTAENKAVGTMTVTAPVDGFAASVARDASVYGAARARPVGHSPDAKPAVHPGRAIEREHTKAAGNKAPAAASKLPSKVSRANAAQMDPLDDKLWGLLMVRANLARDHQVGNKKVRVGILDTGVDGTHPDIAPNFNKGLSRNFTRDIPEVNGEPIDGPCEFRGCVDPADHDDNGHGTHVAGTIGAAANKLGVSGVAPNVTLVNVRGGADSGYFFLQPVVDALTYSADAGLDVVNMSFFVDPWLYNCQANPADTPEAQLEQRTIIQAMTRALNYAHRGGVTLVGALGNNHEDLGNPRTDVQSPNFPPGSEYPRPIDNSTCVDLPVEGPWTIGVSALGPSGVKSDYSNYGTEQISVSAPGGYFRDFFGTPWFQTNENLILSTYPLNVAIAAGDVDAAGNITPQGVENGVQKDCRNGKCGFYQYLQGTSMAAPHATGVSALIVSEYGTADSGNPGLTMAPNRVERVLTRTAQQTPCPVPPTVSYENVGRPPEFTATCEGDNAFNGFYGHGIVDAFSAVTRGRSVL